MSKEKIVYGSIKNKVVSSDLLAERANRDFDDENGKALINRFDLGGFFHQREEIQKVIENDPLLRNTHKYYEMSTEEMQTFQMKRLRRAYEIKKDEWFVNHDPS